MRNNGRLCCYGIYYFGYRVSITLFAHVHVHLFLGQGQCIGLLTPWLQVVVSFLFASCFNNELHKSELLYFSLYKGSKIVIMHF